MRKFFTLLACSLFSALPLSAAVIRIQTVISKVIDKDHTELINAPTLTVYGGQPTKTSIGALELALTAVGDEAKAITINSRLIQKTPDGKAHRSDDVPAITIASGQKGTVRVADFQLEFTPTITETPDRSVNFPGGTLTQFLSWLPKSGIMRFDLMAEKADLQTEIPAFTLSFPTGDSLAGALNKFLNPRGLAVLPSQAGVSTFSSVSTVYVLQKFSEPDANKPPGAARFRSYQLSDYLVEKQTVDEITQAIQTAWEMAQNQKADDLRLKFHPGTTLLLVSGPEDAILTVESVLSSLRTKSRADQAARLEAVAAEVRRRRAARVSGASDDLPSGSDASSPTRNTISTSPAAEEIARLEAVADEVRMRREARQAATSGLFSPTSNPVSESSNSATSTTSAPAAEPPKPALDPALEKKRLETVNAEVERRRAARALKPSESTAPAATPEPEKK